MVASVLKDFTISREYEGYVRVQEEKLSLLNVLPTVSLQFSCNAAAIQLLAGLGCN
jgi:hypothetical protein